MIVACVASGRILLTEYCRTKVKTDYSIHFILFYFIRFANYWQSHRNSMTPITADP